MFRLVPLFALGAFANPPKGSYVSWLVDSETKYGIVKDKSENGECTVVQLSFDQGKTPPEVRIGVIEEVAGNQLSYAPDSLLMLQGSLNTKCVDPEGQVIEKMIEENLLEEKHVHLFHEFVIDLEHEESIEGVVDTLKEEDDDFKQNFETTLEKMVKQYYMDIERNPDGSSDFASEILNLVPSSTRDRLKAEAKEVVQGEELERNKQAIRDSGLSPADKAKEIRTLEIQLETLRVQAHEKIMLKKEDTKQSRIALEGLALQAEHKREKLRASVKEKIQDRSVEWCKTLYALDAGAGLEAFQEFQGIMVEEQKLALEFDKLRLAKLQNSFVATDESSCSFSVPPDSSGRPNQSSMAVDGSSDVEGDAESDGESDNELIF